MPYKNVKSIKQAVFKIPRSQAIYVCTVDYIGFWPLNEIFLNIDISANNNNAIIGSAKLVSGPFPSGKMAFLNYDHIRIPQSAALTLNSSFTILFYACVNGNSGPILEYNVEGRDGLNMWFNYNNVAWNMLNIHVDSRNKQIDLIVQKYH